MIKIYRLTDRIPVKIGELTFWLSPLSMDQKAKIEGNRKLVSGVEEENALEGARLAIKFSVKALDGVECANSEPYVLEFDPDGALTDECVSEIMNLDGAEKLVRLALNWALGEIRDPRDWRAAHEKRLAELLSEKKITEKELEKAMKQYPLDGLTVDFAAVRNVKKKLSADGQVH